MSKKASTKAIMLEEIIPKLNRGVRVGSVNLNGRECEALILVLSQSVDIEPLISCFYSLIGDTLIQFKSNDTTKDENHAHNFEISNSRIDTK